MANVIAVIYGHVIMLSIPEEQKTLTRACLRPVGGEGLRVRLVRT